MFIRWQRKSGSAWSRSQHRRIRWTRHRAILVESIRVGGKPRQRHIAFVASFARDRLTASDQVDDFERVAFWRDARARLDALGNRVTAADRSKIEAALAEHVPPPTPAQEDDFDREVEAQRQRDEAARQRLSESIAAWARAVRADA